MDRIDRRAVLSGAATAIVICLPLAIVGLAVGDGPLATLVFLGILAGFVVGGSVAAGQGTASPFTNGGLAALLAFLAIQVTAAVVNAVRGEATSIPGIVFNGLVAYACGLAGGAITSRRRARMDG